jgi:hypothetical protein
MQRLNRLGEVIEGILAPEVEMDLRDRIEDACKFSTRERGAKRPSACA